jgi:hypothetical protein
MSSKPASKVSTAASNISSPTISLVSIGTLRVRFRGDIIRTLALKPDAPELVGIAQRVGSLIDEEIDRARRDEARVRYSRGEDS